MPITMKLLPDGYTVHRLDGAASMPMIPAGEPWYSVVRSPAELSICCRSALAFQSEHAEYGWRVLAVDGPLPFELTGIAAAITRPLAEAEVPVFVVSSYDTDYLLLKEQDLDRGVAALQAAGIAVSRQGSADSGHPTTDGKDGNRV